jgi:nucleoside-diphosphate-sugar epimerase
VLTELLAETSHDVVGIDPGWFRSCTFGAAAANGVEEIREDLRDLEGVDLTGFDAIIHLAALSNDPLGDIDARLTAEINHRTTVRLAELAKGAGVERFLFASSCSIYGAAGDNALDEHAPFNPVTAYAQSKVASEHDLSRLADDRFSPTYLRNATCYGSSPRLRVDLVLNNLVAAAITTGTVRLLSDGTPWRPLLHVEDMCRAFLAAAEAPREAVHDQAFNVGRDQDNYRVIELAEIVADTVPGSRVEIADGAGPDKRTYRVDFGKIARRLPGFQPRWDARGGARQLYDQMRAAGFSREDFDGPRYKRLARIRELQASGALGADLRWVAEGVAA